MKNEDRLTALEEEISIHIKVLLVLCGIILIFGTLIGIGLIYHNNRISDLETSTINVSEWIETCEYETIEKSRIVDPRNNGCDQLCWTDYYCWDFGHGLVDCDIGRLDGTACKECHNETEPYIYIWTEEVCTQEILIKK